MNRLAASLAFATSAAFATQQVRLRLQDRGSVRRMRQIAGLLPPEQAARAPLRMSLPHPLRTRHQRKRNELLSSQLAPALELVVGHLRIGRNINAAMTEVAESITEPLRSIFVEALEESRLGTPLSDTLLQVSQKEGNRHLGVVASAIGLQSRHGGSLVETLEGVHTTIEEEDRLRRDIQTLTADSRLSAKVLLALPPLVLVAVSILNPGYATTLITDPLGQRMSMGATALAFVGWRWLRHLGNPEVVA